MEQTMKIGFVTIHVSDLDKTISFYENVMGFSIKRRFKAGPQVEIVFMDDGSGNQLEFITGTGHFVEAKGISIGFNVEDIEKTHDHLKNNGVRIVFGPATMPSGVKLLHAVDLNGVELGFVQGM
jgi:lactoylglutathione lyase